MTTNKIINWLKKFVCKDCSKIKELNNCLIERDEYKHGFEEVTNQYLELVKKNNEKTALELEADYWNNKYSKKNIFYMGRPLKTSSKDLIIECDIKNFITPKDNFIQNLINENGLQVVNPIECNNTILKIYKFCRKNSVYMYDNTLFGKNEVWMFPFEFLRLKKNGDCDDNSHYIASMLIGAGVPAFRVRVVCGMCKWGGHSTVYVLGDDLKNWYHINSTGGGESNLLLTDFPTTNSNLDSLGIKDVWFSFNNEYSWSDFETQTTASIFNEELGKVIRIE